MAKLKRYNGSGWVEVLDGKALGSANTTRPTNINTIQWHEPNGFGQGGYLEYVTAFHDATGVPSAEASSDNCLLNFGWDNDSWGSQMLVCSSGATEECRVYVRNNYDNIAGKYSDWKRLAFASEVPTVYDWAKKSDLSGAINTLSTGTATPADNDYYVTQYAGGGSSVTTYHRRPHYALWNYVKEKINSATDVTAAKATTATNVSDGEINNAIINLHPESSMTLLPYITNDLAFLTMRGYTAVIRNLTTGTDISSDGGMFNCFDGSTSYFGFTVSATTDVVEIVIKHKQFNWGQQNYIGFGNSWWGAQSVKWESGYSPTGTGTAYSADSDITWTTVGSSEAVNNIYKCNGGSDYDSTSPCNYTRITLTNFRNTSPRIAQIGKIEYGSSLLQMVYVPKSGGEFYGSVTAASFVKKNGTSSQFLKADGSVDSTTYAKKSELPTVNNAKLTIQANGTDKGTFTANASSDVTINIKASDLGLSGAMKFIGTTTTGISEGSTAQSILIGTATVTAEAGNVVLKGDKEFIWTGSKWEELGDESSHALKSVTVKGSGILSGGGTLEANREITHSQVARTNSSTMSATPGFGQSFTAIGGVGSDSYGHVNAVDTKTITIPNTTASQSSAGLMSASDKTKLDGIAEGANSITYSLSATDATDSGDAAITLTPSSGDAQTVEINTVHNAKSADKATHDSDGNIITSTYVKNTSDSVLSGWAKTFSIYLNKEAYPNGIPWLSSTKSTIMSQLTGEYATISALDYLSLVDASKKSVTANSITTTSNRTYAVMRNSDSQLVVNVPWTETAYTLPTATASTLGGIKTTFSTNSEYGLTFTNGNYGISLKGYGAGIQFATSNYRITDIETGTISLSSQAFTAGTSVAKSVTFHNTSYVSTSGGTASGAKQGSLRVFLQFVGYNGEYMTCGLINLSDTGFTAYVRSTDTLSASSTRYIHWIKVREY